MLTWTTAGKIPPDEMQCQENCEQIQRSFLQGCPSAAKVSRLSDCSRPACRSLVSFLVVFEKEIFRNRNPLHSNESILVVIVVMRGEAP